MNNATDIWSGAIDIIVVKQPNGEMKCTPFHVRFGRLKVLRSREKTIRIMVNGKLTDLKMKIGELGECFFVHPVDGPVAKDVFTSPIHSPTEAPSSPTEVPSSPRSSDDGLPSPKIIDIINQQINDLNVNEEEEEEEDGDLVSQSEEEEISTKSNQSQDNDELSTGNNNEATKAELSSPTKDTNSTGTSSSSVNKWTNWIKAWTKSDESSSFNVKPNHFIEQKFLETLQNKYNYDAENGKYLRPKPPTSNQLDTAEDLNGQLFNDDEENELNVENLLLDLVPTSVKSSPQSISNGKQKAGMRSRSTSLSDSILPKSKREENGADTSEKLTATLPDSLKTSNIKGKATSLPNSPSFENFFDNFEDGQKQFQRDLDKLQQKKMQRQNSNGNSNKGDKGDLSSIELSPSKVEEKIKDTNTKSSRFSWNSWLWYSSDTAQVNSSHDTKKEEATATITQGNLTISTPSNYQKSLRPLSSELKDLNLKYGRNEITFLVTSRILGTQEITADIYLWNHDDKIVVSDVDGTITRSDTLGHILPMFGKDWSHIGITELYQNIVKNGYKLLYLTSRSIIQTGTTRRYLRSVKQGGYELPEGPIICSPGRLFECLTREVIMRKPEEFKIAALKDIKTLFVDPLVGEPYDTNDTTRGPFYAGFGNRITDIISYRAVAIPADMIFTVDHTGKVVVFGIHHASYSSVKELVEYMFPGPAKTDQIEYSDFNYWRLSISEDKGYLDDLKSTTTAKK
jgi:phosphatidate phosphatase LPIN